MKSGIALVVLATVCCLQACKKDTTTTNDGPYYPQVKTIIQTNCISCHAPGGQGQPLYFTTDVNICNNAQIIKATTVDPVSPSNRRMPQGGPELSAGDKDIITRWAAKGGKITD